MNVIKIQQDIIKDCLTGKANKWWLQMTDAEAIVGTNYQIYLIDIKDFLLHKTRLINSGVREITSAKKMLDESGISNPTVKTGITRQIDKYKCMELKVDDELIYVDESLLKYYDKTAEFDGTDGKSPVYIYEDEILVGMVLPVKVV